MKQLKEDQLIWEAFNLSGDRYIDIKLLSSGNFSIITSAIFAEAIIKAYNIEKLGVRYIIPNALFLDRDNRISNLYLVQMGSNYYGIRSIDEDGWTGRSTFNNEEIGRIKECLRHILYNVNKHEKSLDNKHNLGLDI